MARICYDHPYVNVAEGSRDLGTGAVSTDPQYRPGWEIVCDSGRYKYLKANGAVLEGQIVKYLRSGQIAAIANFDATPLTTTISGAVPTDCGICVTSGGLTDNQWGWFWLGSGEEYIYLTSGVASYTQLCTWTSAGHLAASGSGDNVADLVCIDSTTSSGTALRLARSNRLLATNFVCSTA